MFFFSLIITTLDNRPVEFKRLLDSLKNQTFKNFELIVVSQGNDSLTKDLLNECGLSFSHFFSSKKGLSIARNIGLKHVHGHYASISDDDCWYPTDALEKVYNTFFYNPSYSVACFQIFDPISDIFYKKYFNQEHRLNRFSICKVSSIEIFFNNEIIEKGVIFDERFGLGGIYNSGEENLFLNDILRCNYHIYYVPKIIVYHRRYANRKVSMDFQYVKGKFYLFQNLYPLFGFIFYYIFYIKHFVLIESKRKSLFPFL